MILKKLLSSLAVATAGPPRSSGESDQRTGPTRLCGSQRARLVQTSPVLHEKLSTWVPHIIELIEEANLFGNKGSTLMPAHWKVTVKVIAPHIQDEVELHVFRGVE